MKPATAYQPPIQQTPATLGDILSVQSALTALLAEEADYMDAMKLAEVGALQERKLKLTGMLERYMRYVRQHPEVLTGVSGEEKSLLQESAAKFEGVMKRNYDTLLVARAVNKTVVKCVTQLVARKEQNPVYTARGANKTDYRPLPVSITLNETV